MPQALADILQRVGEGPADAHGFLRQAHRRLVVNPAHLIRQEIPGQFLVRRVNAQSAKNGSHGKILNERLKPRNTPKNTGKDGDFITGGNREEKNGLFASGPVFLRLLCLLLFKFFFGCALPLSVSMAPW